MTFTGQPYNYAELLRCIADRDAAFPEFFRRYNIPASEKDYIYFRSSVIAGYDYRTDHVMPTSRKAYDALDYYGVYCLLDALIDYSFNGNTSAKDVALGNGSAAQVTMPSYNGQTMVPLEVTDNPTAKYPQNKYQFQCSGLSNPRSGYCE